ncbi:universal stress protein a-like protein [Fagus crenata]
MAEVLSEGGAEKKVMVAIDESEYSYYALNWVLDNLKESIIKSPLVIFMAQLPPQNAYTFAASLGSAPPEFVSSVKENQKKLALALLEKAKEICASRGDYNS